MNEFIYYKVGDDTVKVPSNNQKEFEKRIPDARVLYTHNGQNIEVPVKNIDAFVSKIGAENITYSAYDDNNEYAPELSTRNLLSFEEPKLSLSSASMPIETTPDVYVENNLADVLRDKELSRKEKRHAIRDAKKRGEAPTWIETTGKSTGAAGVTTGKMALDIVNEGAKLGRVNPIANNPLTNLAAAIEAFTGKSVLDEDSPLNVASEKIGKTAERLSMEADPTGGEMGFGELMKTGHIGLAMQKALGSGIESAPIMLATKNPYTATLYMVGMAASNYADDTRENPDIPAWKRGVNAVGSAALELAIEKIADIPWKYFKGASGELTEDIVRNVTERAVEEGAQTIAKRIRRVLGNTLKDAASEGAEEFFTSLGNDALGSALDAIDGNSDYGFKAQWEDFKAQNPDATENDFAYAKGREYIESFLGGALSSVYISGAAQIVKEKRDANARKNFNNAYLYGATLDYGDMYDINDDVNLAINNAVESTKNKNGETTLTREFVENLSADEAFALSRSEDVSPEQRAAFGNLAAAKAQQNGLNEKLNDRVSGEISELRTRVEQAAENGKIVSAIHNGKNVYVKGAAVNKDGSISLPNGQSGPVVVIEGDNKYTVDSKEISNAKSQSVEEYMRDSAESAMGLDARLREDALNTISPKAKTRDVQQYANSKVLINTGNGLSHVEVQAILPNGKVLIKGKKGDLGGQSEILMDAPAFYDAIARNDDGTPVFVEALPKQQQHNQPQQAPVSTEDSSPAQTQIEETEVSQDFRDREHDILIDGKKVTVTVSNQDDASDMVTYTYTGEDGQKKTESTTVAGFADAIQQAKNLANTESTTNENVVTDTENNIVDETNKDVKPKDDEEDEDENNEVATEDINWDTLLKDNPQAFFTELHKRFGERATRYINALIASAQNELDKLNKANPVLVGDVIANEDKKLELQKRIDTLNGMLTSIADTPAVETEFADGTEHVTPESAVHVETNEVPATEVVEETMEEAAEPVEEVTEEPVAPETVEKNIEETTDTPKQPIAVEAENESAQAPVAPNPVSNPVEKAKKREETLRNLLDTRGVDPNFKADRAKATGREVADMFATREDYEEYQATVEDFGEFTDDFNDGVDESFANRPEYQISDDKLGVNSAAQQLTVDALMESLNGYIDVVLATGKQVIKMLKSSEPIELMGTRVNNRRNAIAQYFSGKQLSTIEQSIVNAFAHGVKNESINVTRNGVNKRINLKQGREQNAGVSHSIFKHYDTSSNNYTAAELLLIPDVIQNGTETKNGNKISYSYSSNGITYTVTTEIHDRTENFSNFFTDRKPTTGNSSNTVKQHVHPQQSVSTANVSNNSATTNKNSLLRTTNGTVYGWTDGKKIYLTKAGINPNTPIHEYTHIWAKAMMQKNPNGWNNIKKLLKGNPMWDKVVNDPYYSNIINNEDAIASEVLSRISGSRNAAKMEKMAQEMIDNAKSPDDALKARGLIQNMREALNKFWGWVGKNFFEIENFKNVDEVTDRVLFDLLNKTDLGTLSEGQVETQIVTDPKVIAELEASPKVQGFRNVVMNPDGTFSSPMAYWLQSTKEGAKSRVETAKFELGKWEEAEEHPELVDENGKVTLVKPNKKTVDKVAYDPYIHNRLEPVNLQFKDAWKRDDLVYVKTEVSENDLNDGYHADKALLPVGVHSWSNGDVMLSRYDKPVEIISWEDVADAWAKRLDGNGVEFDVVPPSLRQPLIERGVEIIPPHKGMGKDCNDAYVKWKKDNEILSRRGEKNANFVEQFEFKKNNESGQLEYSDEFRGLQEESARMSEQLVSEKDGVQRAAIRGLVERIGRTLQRELDRAISGRGYKLRNVVNKSKGTSFDIIENVDGRLFHDIFAIVKAYLPNGELVDLHDNYNDAICYITSDGLAGFAVDANGNLISVYSLYGASKKGFLGAIKDLITEAGATHLDGYNSQLQPLAEIYSKVFGWKVASMMDYNMDYDHDNIAKNHGMPQVAFMVNTDADIETKHFNKDQYDEAVEYQAEQVDANNRVDSQNTAVENLSGNPRNGVIENAVNEEAAKLGVSVTYKTREQMPKGHKNDKGYYNTKNGEIVICTENATSVSDAIKTILHEAVAHKGLRKLMGDKFNEFINRVYNSLDAETKAKVDAIATANHNGNTAVAMEEYMALLAEKEDFNKNTAWKNIKSAFQKTINKIFGRNDVKIGDNELRYILRASYNNLVNPKGMDSIRGWAQDQIMREELGINEANNATPEILSRTGIDEIAFTSAREAYETVTFNSFTEIMNSIRNATGFKAKVQAIKEGWLKVWNEYQMENQDAQQAVITGIEAIQKETGNIPVQDFENYLYAENQMRARAAKEIESFLNKHFAPIVDQINDIITSVLKARGLDPKNKNLRIQVNNEVRQYLIAKHGLERNAYYQATTGKMRDFSGLTALFGLPATDFALAETMAKDVVDKFETEIGDATRDSLWKKINAATNKTLRHAYESGMLSRAQYDKIKDMFDFYIPLRGFDEKTAENVYQYGNYEGNSFQPVTREAHGRTSVAFDPIAMIMNMAQSEIIQGNKNRVKQALYHFIGNRPNTLLVPRDCWYVLDKATGAFVEAYPDIANGETWEQFEIRMQALATTGDALKQTNGLNIGYRFEKPRHKNEHYIHLKINGVEHAIYVNGNPRLAEGVNGFDKKTNDVLDGIKKANRTASQLFTNYSYKFGGKNFIRDFIWAQTVMLIKESPMYNLRFARNWFANNPITIGSLMKNYKNGTLDMSKENHRLFKEFVENGGETGYVFIDKLENQKRKIDKAIERMTEIGNTKTNVFTKAAVLLNIIQYVNECIELSSRFGTYVTSRKTKDKSGNVRSITQSINDAKGITTNFNRKGAQSGRGLIGGVANFMGSWNFFYNAAVQGVQQIKGLHNEHPWRTKIVLGGWAGLGFAMPYIIDIFRGDDDDDELYWNIPEYERKNNICLPFGKGKVSMTIPLSPIIREAYAIGVTISDAMFNKSVDKDATMLSMECASLLAKALVPANPIEGLDAGLTPAENMIMFATPDIADPIAEIAINKDWTGTPIEYRTSYNEGAPHYTKVVGKNNWKESIGEKLYKMGEDNLSSSKDWNLSAWEHVFSSGIGGIGVMMKDITNCIKWVTEWEAPERLNDIPVARTLFSSNAMDDEKFVNNVYWDMDDVYKKKTKVLSSVYGLTEKEAFVEQEGFGESNLVKVYEAKAYPFLKKYYELNQELAKKQKSINKMPTDTEVEKNDKVLAEQDLFNKKRDMVYELLEYEID